MQLKDYLNILWRRKWIILLTSLATFVVVAFGTSLVTPVYQTSTTLRIAASVIDTQNYALYTYNEQLMNTYAEIATSRPITAELTNRLDLGYLPDIKAEVVPNTELIKITARSSNPKVAAMTANSLAEILVTQSNKLYTGGEKNSQDVLSDQLAEAQAKLDTMRESFEKLLVQQSPSAQRVEASRQLLQIEQENYSMLLSQYEQARLREAIRASMITVVEEAVVPQQPVLPRVSLNYVLGLLAGLIGGLVLAFVFENLDSTLYSSERIESDAEIPTLGKLPYANREQLNIATNNDSSIAEAFRNLAINLQASDPQNQKKVLLVMSAEPTQGVSTVVSNLSYSLAELGRKVIAVDCNLHLPKLDRLFGVSNAIGLVEVLEQKLDFKDAIQGEPNKLVHVLTSGSVPSNPCKLVTSPLMAKLIRDLDKQFDYVLMDTPALLASADICTLAQYADGLILVVRRGHAKREAVQAARKFLTKYQKEVIGLIINQDNGNQSYSLYHYQRKPKLSQTKVMTTTA